MNGVMEYAPYSSGAKYVQGSREDLLAYKFPYLSLPLCKLRTKPKKRKN
ncbi:MAG: hypothetical protein WAL79_06860 [Nitrososphaeraceae archaeon]